MATKFMETIDQCDLCGENKPRLLFEGRDRFSTGETTFKLVTCKNCGLIALNPRPDPEEIGSYYPDDYISFHTAIEDEPSRLKRLERAYGIRKFYKQLAKRIGAPPKKILDIGAATGIFLNEMQQHGWETYGVEPSEYAASYGRERFGLNIKTAYLHDTTFASDFFDVVTMWDVLEHVPSPTNVLREIHRILKPGGWLVVSLPNPDSWERKWFGEYWSGWDIPRHFHIISAGSAKRYFQKTGFDWVDLVSFTGRHGAMTVSVEFWLASVGGSRKLKQFLLKMLRSLPARVLTLPFYFVADTLNKSSTMTIFARKRVE